MQSSRRTGRHEGVGRCRRVEGDNAGGEPPIPPRRAADRRSTGGDSGLSSATARPALHFQTPRGGPAAIRASPGDRVSLLPTRGDLVGQVWFCRQAIGGSSRSAGLPSSCISNAWANDRRAGSAWRQPSPPAPGACWLRRSPCADRRSRGSRSGRTAARCPRGCFSDQGGDRCVGGRFIPDPSHR